MPYQLTTATKKVTALNRRIRIVQGGSSASKTVSVVLYLIARAQSDAKPTLTSVVSETLPHLKKGAIRDFLAIMQEHRYFKDELWNKTDLIYTFETGSKIEFFSVDQPGKVRGPRRDRLFINEANNVSLEAFEQLEIRTNEFVIMDYNPVGEFWVHDIADGSGKGIKDREDAELIILTYKDNEALSQEIVKTLELRKERKSWWRVYGEGQLGEVEGRIYTGWKIIDEIPHEARLERRWLDFGYSNDPTAIGDLYYFNGGYILDEQLYQKGLSNKQIAEFILNLPKHKTLVVADSAEPKSIDEIRLFGVNILPAVKGKDSVKHGIQVVQDQQISITKNSVNILNEYRKYLWLVDKDGRILNEEDPLCENHHMAGIRYAMGALIPSIQRRDFIASRPRYENTKRKLNPAV